MGSLALGHFLSITPFSKERIEAWGGNAGPGGGKCVSKFETFRGGRGEDFKADK